MSNHRVRIATESDRPAWNDFLERKAEAGVYQMFEWRDVIQRTYGHPTYFLICQESHAASQEAVPSVLGDHGISGVLPLVHMRHAIFGNSLVSMPFLDGGGVLSDSEVARRDLVAEAVGLGRSIGATRIELRQEWETLSLADVGGGPAAGTLPAAIQRGKVRMLLQLPESGQLLMDSFKSKLRSQISKPIKEGLTSRDGAQELLEDFYRVFLVNMRDLGSPVHSLDLMRNVLDAFPGRARVFVVYKDAEPVAASVVVGSKEVLRNPWSSSLRQYSSLSPNMLLYLRMLEYACDQGYRTFDFGRSTPGEGTFRFKEQWGAKPAPLYWHNLALDGRDPNTGLDSSKFELATRYWQKLPVFVTRILGPPIRKHISL